MIQDFATFFIFFAGGLSVLFSAGQLFVKGVRMENVNLSALFLFLGLLVFQLGFISGGLVPGHPRLLLLHLTCVFIVSPLLYFAYHLVVFSEERLPARIFLLLLPTAGAFLMDAYYFSLSDEASQSLIRDILEGVNTPRAIVFKVAYVTAAVQIIIYLGFLFRKLLSVWDLRERNDILDITLIYDVLSITAVLLLSAGYILNSLKVLRGGAVYIALIIVGVYLTGQRHPRFLQLLIVEAGKKRYLNSQLAGLEIETLCRRLFDLMEEKKLYALEEISLKSIAKELQITPHQLSQLLNERLSTNFNSFINQYRISDAKRMLIEEPARSVLSIAYSVGFNSK